MSFRIRLLIVLTGLCLLTNGFLFAILYTQFRDLLYHEIRSHALSVAATTAALFDGDLHEAIHHRSDESTHAYRKLVSMLRRARDVNRRGRDIDVKFIYTIRNISGTKEYVLDAEEDPKLISHVGDRFQTTGPPVPYGKLFVDKDFTTDEDHPEWGHVLTAYAPIQNSDGSVVAQVGVDLTQQNVVTRIGALRTLGLGALVASVALAIATALVLSKRVSSPLVALRDTVNRIEAGDLNARTDIHSKDEFGVLAHAVNEMGEALLLKSAFARYVSKEVMDEILETRQLPSLKGERRSISVLFADIRGFTSLSEHLAPEEVVTFLNDYFDRMVKAIFRNNGTLDKFIGDGLMAVFGALIKDEDHARHAICAALEMQEELRKLCEEWRAVGRMTIRIGVGVHSGDAVVGNMGSNERMDYTAIGDTVNLASRLETATREHNVDVLVSDDIYRMAKNGFSFREMGEFLVKGREQPVRAYAVEKEQ